MARDKGLLNISANFEPQTAQPFDARMRVQTLADLTNATQWEANDGTVYAYVGMITVVYNDTINNGLYRLEQADYTNILSWSKVGDGGTAGSVDWANIEGDITQNTDLQDAINLKEDKANKNQANGYVGLDANTKIDISYIPNSSLERLIIVADETARFALTTTVAQNGDVVKQQDIGTVFYIVDDTNLNNSNGYEEFAVGTAGAVEWSNILNKPIDIFYTGINTTDDITEGTTNLFDKEVIFTGGNNVTITGTYPSFEIQDNTTSSSDIQNALDTKLNSADNLTDVADQQTALNNVTAVAGATDEYVLTKDTSTGNALWKEVISSDELLKVSSNDTTAGYLEDKIVVSSGTNTTNILEVSTLNDGTDEDLQIQIDESKIDHNNLTGVDALGSGVTCGHISDGAETIYGIKTFDSFPVTPSSEPTSDYEVANKSYVDSRGFSYLISKGEIGEIKEWSWSVLPDGFLSLDGATINKVDYPDFFEFLILQGEITETDETYTLSTVADGIIRVEDDFNSIYEVVDSVPVGAVSALAATTIPDGWLECNGALLSRTTYSELFATIGTTYGAGDGSTTFKLPDLRGEFIRGLDNGRGVDTGRTLGSIQLDELKAHNHVIQLAEFFTNSPTGSFAQSRDVQCGGTQQVTSSSGGTETRPRNMAMRYIIKYKIGDGRLS